MFEGKCPNCNQNIEISFHNDDENCPECGYGGWWEEEYTDDNYWMVWYWDKKE